MSAYRANCIGCGIRIAGRDPHAKSDPECMDCKRARYRSQRPTCDCGAASPYPRPRRKDGGYTCRDCRLALNLEHPDAALTGGRWVRVNALGLMRWVQDEVA